MDDIRVLLPVSYRQSDATHHGHNHLLAASNNRFAPVILSLPVGTRDVLERLSVTHQRTQVTLYELKSRWVTRRARWVTRGARWETRGARWVTTLKARWVTLIRSGHEAPRRHATVLPHLHACVALVSCEPLEASFGYVLPRPL